MLGEADTTEATTLAGALAADTQSGQAEPVRKFRRRRRRGRGTASGSGCRDEEDQADDEVNEALGRYNTLLRTCGWPVEVRYAQRCGRYVVVTRDVAAGELVLREAAYATAANAPQQGMVCHTCARYSEALLSLTCNRCRQVSFCSPACASPSSGKAVHPKVECRALQRLHTDCNIHGYSIDEIGEMRLLIRLLALRWSETRRSRSKVKPEPATNEMPKTVETAFVNFMDLVSNTANYGQAIRRFRRRAGVVWEACTDSDGEGETLKGLEEDDLVEFIGRAESNSFARYHVAKRKAKDYGSAIFNMAATINHSCMPSVSRHFDGKYLSLRALRPLRKGEEVTITYIPLRGDTPKRQSYLQQHYCFTCSCERCEAKTDEVEQYSTNILLCPADDYKCDGLMMFLGNEIQNNDSETAMGRQKCQKCGFVRDMDPSLLRPAWLHDAL